ncbi:S1C family serine protease [Pseudoxanthomonas gei]|nr:PDZ domain-containing protein [Pseudoxanthomonas gei]
MHRLAWLALVAGSLISVGAKAQTATTAPQGFGFCTVTDSSSAQARIWASPVFALTHASSDPAGFQRSQELAGEFLAHVTSLGGTGSKSCVVLATREEAAAFREEQRATWNERLYFIKIGDWREVAWQPAAWSPAAAAAAPAELIRYFYCYQVDTDVLPSRSHTVATTVFARTLPGGDPMAGYDMAARYTLQFKQQVRAHGLPENGDCAPYDTRAEAEYQQQQIRKHFKGFNMKFDEVAWTPSEAAIVPAAATPATPAPAPSPQAASPAKGIGVRISAVNAELAQALGLSSTQGAWVVEVADGSAAMKAGLKPMDVLVEIAGQAVNAYGDVTAIVGRLRPGFEAPLRVWRQRRMQDLTLTIPGMVPAPTATTIPALPVPALPAAPAIAATTTDAGRYCTAFVTRSKEQLLLRVPVWQVPASQASQAAMGDSVSRLIAAVIQAHPAKWTAFPPVTCHDNSGVFAGETFCFSNTYKHFGGAQMAAQFCNSSKEAIDNRWADMVKADGGNARLFPWPAAP